MAMSTVAPPRCTCGRYLRRRLDVGDILEADREEEIYGGYEWEECACGGDVRAIGDGAPAPEQRARGGRPSSGHAKRPVRNYRYRCACEGGPPIRCGRRDLDVTCGRCGCRFTWDPSGSEQLTPIRVPA